MALKGRDERQVWSGGDLTRQFDLTQRQLESWQKQGLFPAKTFYHFDDLIALQVLLKLRALGVSPRKLKTAVASIQSKLRHIEDPLKELKVFVDGNRIQVQTAGRKMEALSGQLLLDFDADDIKKLLTFPGRKGDDREKQRKARADADHWFQRGLELEQSGSDKREAISAYEQALELHPQLAGALVNIGTIYFNARKWRESERFYQRAIESDGTYPLAHFNLANLHEELGRTSLAIQHYKKALELAPAYADAHYNLALLYQTRDRNMEALRHWKLYLKLDASSHWATIARREMTRLKEAAIVGARPSTPSSETA